MNYSDDEFTAAFESCSIEPFHHSDHIRLARIYCDRFGLSEAEHRMTRGIRRFAEHAGHPEKYHHTLTVAWTRLVAAARKQPDGPVQLLNKEALTAYYSAELLLSDRARREWVEPDLAPLPG